MKITRKSLLVAEFSWNTDYASYVHEGVVYRRTVRFRTPRGWMTILAGTRYPPRRWTEQALKEFDFAETFGDLINSTGDVEQAFREACLLLGRAFTQAISSPTWQWTDGENRDIVDTGQLRQSQNLDFL